MSTPLLILAVLACVVVLSATVASLARLRGWDPQWVARTRHAFGEAGYRVSGLWAEFSDWLRLGSR